MKKFVVLFFILGVWLTPTFVFAETEAEHIENLRVRIAELESQLTKLRKDSAVTTAQKESLQKEITTLTNGIKGFELQIAITSTKIDKTKTEITGLSDEITTKQSKIRQRKGTIGRLILFLNRHDNENLLTSLLKNKNISKFFRDEQYAANISTELLEMIDELRDAKEELEVDKGELEEKQDVLEELNEENAAKRASLNQVKSTKDKVLKLTKGQEAQYQKMIADIEKKKAIYFSELRNLESNAVAGGLYIVHVIADKLPPKGTALFRFPYDGYRITQNYGMTTYARRGAYGGNPHSGVDIVGGFGTGVKAIGDGKIVANGINNPAWGNWVAVQHTSYNLVSLYGHLSGLAPLKPGTAVKAGDIVGYEGSTGFSTGSHLHLSIYKEFFTYVNEKTGLLNPSYFTGTINPLDYIR